MRIKSREQILEELVRKIRVNTDITDFSAGSQISTILEGIATKLFQTNLDILRTLESNQIDTLSDEQLDRLAVDSLLPNLVGGVGRTPATPSKGELTFSDNSFEKIEGIPFAGKTAPFAGVRRLFITGGENFPETGSVYIGRGTVREEGPINYTSRLAVGSYYVLELSSPLLYDHPYIDAVLLAQGGNRTIPQGTICVSASTTPSTQFKTDREVTLLDGNISIKVSATSIGVGLINNAKADKINSVDGIDLTVTNDSNFTGARDVETSNHLRNRLKKWQRTLSRGSITSIVNSLIGLSTSKDSIESVSVLPTINPDDALKLYIDNSALLETELENHTEIIASSLTGIRRSFKLKNTPIAPVHLVSQEGPFAISEDHVLTIVLDGLSYSFKVRPSYYRDIRAASAYEIANDFNEQHPSTLEFRIINSGTSLLISGSDDSEQIECIESSLQSILNIPLRNRRSLYLYVNGQLQNYKNVLSRVESRNFSSWSIFSGSILCQIAIDGIDINFTITDFDFRQYATTLSTATISQYAEVFTRKIPSVNVEAKDDVLVFTNLNPEGKIEITGGEWIGINSIFFPTQQLISESKNADFKFNRLTGDIYFLRDLTKGSRVEAATVNSQANILSQPAINGRYDLSTPTEFSSYLVISNGNTIRREITPTLASRVGISLDSINNLMILTDLESEGIFNDIHAGDYFSLTANEDANPTLLDTLNGTYTVVRLGLDGDKVTSLHLDIPVAFIPTVSSVVNDVIVTQNMFHAFYTDGIVEELVIDKTIFTVNEMCEYLNSRLTNFKCNSVSGNQLRMISKNFQPDEEINIVLSAGVVRTLFIEEKSISSIHHKAYQEIAGLNSTPFLIPEEDSYIYNLRPVLSGYNLYNSDISFNEYPLSNHLVGMEQDRVASFAILDKSDNSGSVSIKLTEHDYLSANAYIGQLKHSNISNIDTYRPTGIFTSPMNTLRDVFAVKVNDTEISIPLFKTYEITNATLPSVIEKGSIINFELKDPTNLADELDANSALNLFDEKHPLRYSSLEGCRLHTRSIAAITLSGSSIVVKNREYGDSNRIMLVVDLAQSANTASNVTHKVRWNEEDNTVDKIIITTIGSQPSLVNGTINTGELYSIKWLPEVDGLCDVEFSTRTEDTYAKAESAEGLIFTANTVGILGNGATIDIVDDSVRASVPSGTEGIIYTAIPVGVDGNGITIETINTGSGGLIITDDLVNNRVVINLGGAVNITRQLLRSTSNSSLIEFTGVGFSGSLATHGEQITSGGVGGELIVTDDGDEVVINLAGLSLEVDELVTYFTSNPLSLLTVSGSSSEYVTVQTLVTTDGVDASFGSLDNFVQGHILSIPNSNTLPTGAWLIDSVVDGVVTVRIPSYANKQDLNNISSYENPLTSYPLEDIKMESVRKLIEDYCNNIGIADCSSLGGNLSTISVTIPSWLYTPITNLNTQSPQEAILSNAIVGSRGGSMDIFRYDPTDSIRAVVNSDYDIFNIDIPMYDIEGGDILLTPATTKALELWLNTNVHSTLGSFANIELANNKIIISSREIGSKENIQIINTPVVSTFTNPMLNDTSITNSVTQFRVTDHFSTVEKGDLVKIQDKIISHKTLPYRGGRLFSRNQAIYARDDVDLKKARIFFLRQGQNDELLPESLIAGDSITLTQLSDGLVRVTISGAGYLNARVGETALFTGSIFPADIRNIIHEARLNMSYAQGNLNYIGYPILEASAGEIVILAPNISSFGSYTITADKDIVFMPSLWNLKNIKTYLSEGANPTPTGDECYAGIKSLSNNLYALVVSNTGSFDTDDLKLDTMKVSSGDILMLPNVFPAEHQGDHSIVGYNKNIIIFENNRGAGIETLGEDFTDGLFKGRLNNLIKIEAPHNILIRDRGSVTIGDTLQLPSGSGEWFNSRLIGKHAITDFGFINNFEDIPFMDGIIGMENTVFYVEIRLNENAPAQPVKTSYIRDVNIFNKNNHYYSTVAGSAIYSNDIRDLFLSTNIAQAGLSRGSYITAMNKIPANRAISTGIDGYTTLGGLVQLAHNHIDGDTMNEGWKAAGTRISIMTPLPKFLSLNVRIDVLPDVNKNSLVGLVRGAIISYVNSIPVGQSVVISAMASSAQRVTGVVSVQISSDEISEGQIYVNEKQKVFIRVEDIVVS